MFNKNAELLNGRLAMLGIVAAIGSYALTGQVIPRNLVMGFILVATLIAFTVVAVMTQDGSE